MTSSDGGIGLHAAKNYFPNKIKKHYSPVKAVSITLMGIAV
jgi:hypothetical protein